MLRLSLPRVLRAAILTALVIPAVLAWAVPAAAQPETSPAGAPRPGIYITGLTPNFDEGDPRAGIGEALDSPLATQLADKYSCSDVLTRQDISDLLQFGREQQLLGTPEEQQIQLDEIADALGRSGTLVFGYYGAVGDNYYVQLKAVDLRTAKITDMKTMTGEGSDESILLDLLDQAAADLELPLCKASYTVTINAKAQLDYGTVINYTIDGTGQAKQTGDDGSSETGDLKGTGNLKGHMTMVADAGGGRCSLNPEPQGSAPFQIVGKFDRSNPEQEVVSLSFDFSVISMGASQTVCTASGYTVATPFPEQTLGPSQVLGIKDVTVTLSGGSATYPISAGDFTGELKVTRNSAR